MDIKEANELFIKWEKIKPMLDGAMILNCDLLILAAKVVERHRAAEIVEKGIWWTNNGQTGKERAIQQILNPQPNE